MDAADTAVRVALMELWVDRGGAPAPGEVAERAGVSEDQVGESYGRLHDAHAIVLAPDGGGIWMANPFSAVPTPFTVEAAHGRSYHGNCIWDALGIAAMLGGEGTVRTGCPDCGEPLEMAVEGGSLDGPGGAVAHFVVPAAHWWDDIGFT